MKTAQAQNIFHGGVGQDKRGDGRALTASDQPAVFADTLRERPVNTKVARTKKHSSKRRLQQITSWVDNPLMLQLREHASDKKLSMSEAIRGLLREIMNQNLRKQHQAALPELIDQATAKA